MRRINKETREDFPCDLSFQSISSVGYITHRTCTGFFYLKTCSVLIILYANKRKRKCRAHSACFLLQRRRWWTRESSYQSMARPSSWLHRSVLLTLRRRRRQRPSAVSSSGTRRTSSGGAAVRGRAWRAPRRSSWRGRTPWGPARLRRRLRCRRRCTPCSSTIPIPWRRAELELLVNLLCVWQGEWGGAEPQSCFERGERRQMVCLGRKRRGEDIQRTCLLPSTGAGPKKNRPVQRRQGLWPDRARMSASRRARRKIFGFLAYCREFNCTARRNIFGFYLNY